MKSIDDTMLERYLDGALSRRQARQVERAVAESPALAQRLEMLRLTGSLVREAVAEPVHQADLSPVRAAVLERIAQEKRKEPWWVRIRITLREFFAYKKSIWIPAAAAAVLGIAAVATWPQDKAAPLPQRPGAVTWQAHRAPGHSRAEVTTPADMRSRVYTIPTQSGDTVAVVWVEEEP